MRNNEINSISNITLIDQLREIDSNRQRANVVIVCIKAVEFARQLRYKEALKELTKGLKRSQEKNDVF